MTLEGTVALVTGGARRVGRAIVAELAQAGCDVAIHYRHAAREANDAAAEVASLGRRAITIAGDLSHPATPADVVDRTVAAFGRLDVLVNNASAFLTETPDTVDAFDPALWEMMFRTNVMGPMALSHHARVHLAAHGRGKIINLCDIAADRPQPNHLAYCTTKAALAAVTRGLARALAPSIQVNGVAPGIAIFPESYSVELRRRITQKVPLAREGRPLEVAELVRFLAEGSDYITGQIIAIDGGRSIV